MIAPLLGELAYSPFYWLFALCGIAMLLLPQSMFDWTVRSSRGAAVLRTFRIAGFVAALLCFAVCVIMPVVEFQIGLKDEYSYAEQAFYLCAYRARPVIGFGSLALAVFSLRCPDWWGVQLERGCSNGSPVVFFALSTLFGIARPMLTMECMPECSGLVPLERPSVVLMLLPVVVLMLIWLAIEYLGGRTSLLTSLGGYLYGELLGRIVLRMAPNLYLYFVDRPLLALSGCVVAFGLAAIAVHIVNSRFVSGESTLEVPDEHGPVVLDAAWGLSAREEEAVRYAVDGLSSRAVAERMDIKPSTVRNLQRRAWSKMGVSSVFEARSLIESMQPKSERVNESPADDERARLPLLEIATGAVLLGLCPWLADAGTWFTPLSVCAAAGVGLLGAALLAGLLPDGVKSGSSKVLLHSVLLIFCAVGEVASQVFAPDACPVIALVASWALGLILMERDRAEEGVSSLLVALMASAFFGGAALFILWKGMTWPFVAPVEQFLIPIAANLACALAGLLLLRRVRGAVILMVLCIVALMLASVYRAYGPIYAIWLCAFGFATWNGFATGGAPSVRPIVLSFGIGLMFGVGVLSGIYDMLNLRDAMYGAESGLRLQLVVNFGLGALMALFIVSGVLVWSGVVSGIRRHEIAQRFVMLPEHRIRSALRARGLSDLETDIMMQTFAGETCAHIAKAVNYSMSTVYAIRHDVYRKFGTSGAQQALQTILEVASI